MDSGTQCDADGRLFVLRSEAEISLFFERLGFAVESRFSSTDALSRDAVWATIVSTYSGDSPRPIDRVEAIINRDRKTATYKFALLRALSEIATNTPSIATPVRFQEPLRALITAYRNQSILSQWAATLSRALA